MKSRVNKTWGVRLGKRSPTLPQAMPAVLGAVRLGYDNCRKIATVVGRDKALVSRWVREFERTGLLVRKGRGKQTRFVTTSKWPASRPVRVEDVRLPPATRGTRRAIHA